MSLVILYNFNENDASTVRDYSTNGDDGTGNSLTLAASTKTGYECRFDGSADYISNTYTALNAASNASCRMLFKFPTLPGATETMLFVSGQMTMQITATDTITLSLTTTGTSGSVETSAISADTWYVLTWVYDGSDLKIYLDDTLEDTDSLISGSVEGAAGDLQIGANEGSGDYCAYYLNEFRLYDSAIAVTALALTAYQEEENGIRCEVDPYESYQLGDILASNYWDSSRDAYAIVTYVEDQRNIRLQPLEDSGGTITVVSSGANWSRLGHAWDTTRQSYIEASDSGFCVYGDVSAVADIGANPITCIDENGIIEKYTAVTTTTTLGDGTEWVEVTPSAAFTITMPSSPTKGTIKHFVDVTGVFATYNITISGNGKNLNGSSTSLISSNYEVQSWRYNGTQWNLV